MNKVILMGRLTKDPELKYTASTNVAVCKYSLAVDRRFSKEKQADFFNIVAWEKFAEFCGKYFKKGSKVVVVGRIENRFWDDADGKRHYITEIIAEEGYFAESKKGEETSASSGTSSNSNNQEADGFYPLNDDNQLPF